MRRQDDEREFKIIENRTLWVERGRDDKAQFSGDNMDFGIKKFGT